MTHILFYLLFMIIFVMNFLSAHIMFSYNAGLTHGKFNINKEGPSKSSTLPFGSIYMVHATPITPTIIYIYNSMSNA